MSAQCGHFCIALSAVEGPRRTTVTVLGVDSVDPLALACRASERRGVLLSVKRGGKGRRLLAEQVWADDENSANATVLNDYRYWVKELNGLTPGFG